jgi:hypothetical protein
VKPSSTLTIICCVYWTFLTNIRTSMWYFSQTTEWWKDSVDRLTTGQDSSTCWTTYRNQTGTTPLVQLGQYCRFGRKLEKLETVFTDICVQLKPTE